MSGDSSSGSGRRPSKRLRKQQKKEAKQKASMMMPRTGYTAYGMNYSKNVKTKGKKGWKGKLTLSLYVLRSGHHHSKYGSPLGTPW